MRIKTQKERIVTTPKTKKWWWIPVILLLGIVALWWWNNQSSHQDYFCDMEQVIENGQKFQGTNDQKFTNGQLQSDEAARNGQYSAKATPKQIYGPTLVLENVNEGDIIEASVWQKKSGGEGALILQGGWKSFYRSTSESAKFQSDWELLTVIDTITDPVRNQTVKVFPMLQVKSGDVFFDDLTVTHSKGTVPQKKINYALDNKFVHLKLDDLSLKKIRAKRAEAFKRGNLVASSADLVPAKIKEDGKEIDCQVRLKGDLLDHLQGDRWSFRVVTEEGQSWNGMSIFSVQNSLSRYHLLEWVFHRMLLDEDVLTTRYDFISFDLNEKKLGVYAYEEHFDAPLLISQQRPEGPILRINEDGLWQYASAGLSDDIPWYESAQIEAFSQKEILKDKEFRAQFIAAQNLLFSYKNDTRKPSEVFDLDLMAKFLAIQDICMAYHAFNPTNQRFYYNAITARLEPIGYDGYTPDGIKWYKPPLIYGANVNPRVPRPFLFRNHPTYFHHFLFNDDAMVEKYVHYLEKFSSPQYIDAFTKKHYDAIKNRELFIRQDYPDYTYNPAEALKNAKAIQQVLYPAENVTLRAYKNENNTLTLENYHLLPLVVLGFGDAEMFEPLAKPLVMESYNTSTKVHQYEVSFTKKIKRIFCKTLGTDKIVSLPIAKWPVPSDEFKTTFPKIDQLIAKDYLSVEDSLVIFNTGNHILTEDLLIPAGYHLIINAGTGIQLTNGAGIVSYGAIQANGNVENPIVINSTANGQGILLINADTKTSQFNYVNFHNLKSRNKNGQMSDGGFTAYNSDIKFTNCNFKNSPSKDALQLVVSRYEIYNCQIENASGDGIDADESRGRIVNVQVSNAGKDAVEISGGKSHLENVKVNKCRGAAVNTARRAKVDLYGNCKFTNTIEGIKVADESNVVAHSMSMENVNQGFVVYKKSDEYDPGILQINNYTAKDVNKLHLVEQGATLIIKNKKIDPL